MIKMKLKNIGKVKWIKGIFKDLFFKEGIEFVNTPSQEILQLKEYMSRGVDFHGSDD